LRAGCVVSCFDVSSWAAAKGAEKKLEINATANIAVTTPAGKNLSFAFFIAFPPLTIPSLKLGASHPFFKDNQVSAPAVRTFIIKHKSRKKLSTLWERLSSRGRRGWKATPT
jgi:hypothetical protein